MKEWADRQNDYITNKENNKQKHPPQKKNTKQQKSYKLNQVIIKNEFLLHKKEVGYLFSSSIVLKNQILKTLSIEI